VILTVLLIVPLRPQRVLTAAFLGWFRALRQLLDAVFGRAEGSQLPLRPLVRELDAAYAALEATAAPLRRATFGRNSAQLTELLSVASAARQYLRSLAAQIEDASEDQALAAGPAAGSLRAAADQLGRSLDAVEHRIRTGERGCYTRSAALVALTLDNLRPRHSPVRHALRDLTLLDGALARLAAALRMEVDDHDTVAESAPAIAVGRAQVVGS
jgi:hypothetical protein